MEIKIMVEVDCINQSKSIYFRNHDSKTPLRECNQSKVNAVIPSRGKILGSSVESNPKERVLIRTHKGNKTANHPKIIIK
jgi:hypothetical protein